MQGLERFLLLSVDLFTFFQNYLLLLLLLFIKHPPLIQSAISNVFETFAAVAYVFAALNKIAFPFTLPAKITSIPVNKAVPFINKGSKGSSFNKIMLCSSDAFLTAVEKEAFSSTTSSYVTSNVSFSIEANTTKDGFIKELQCT